MKSSTITGTVTDSTGATIPGATVTVTNLDTNVSVVTRSTSSGDYTVPYLIAGPYKVVVDKDGFSTATASGAELTNDSTARVNVTLTIGGANTVVQVDTGSSSLQTEDASVQGSVDAQIIDSIPNINENPLLYATLTPGVVAEKSAHDTTSTDSFSIGPHSRRAQSMISVNGGLGLTNDIQLDGVPILGSDYNEEGIVPNQEGLQEVRVQTNTFTAEFGRGTGIIQYSTKSGANQYHGSAVYRARNEAFNANGFSNNFNGLTRGAYKVDYYGGSVGGAVIRDKLFFFASYEGLYHTNPVDFLLTVPTALERQGDFSQTLTAGNDNEPVPVQLYNPFSVTPVVGDAGTYQRAQIPNAVLTGSLLDPVGQKLYSNYPMPNRTPSDVYGTHNFYTRKAQVYHRNSTQARVDYKYRNNSFYGAGGIASGNVNVPQPLGADNPFYPPVTWGQVITDSNPYAAVGDTVILSPTLVLDVRYGVNRMKSLEGYGPKSSKFDVTPYQIPSSIQALFNDPTEPFDFCPEGKYDCLNFSLIQHINEKQTDHNAVASVTKTLNKWTLKTGAEYRVGLLNAANPSEATFEVGNRWANQNYTSQYTDATGDTVGGSLVTSNQQYGFQAAQYMMGAGYLVAGSSVASALAMKYTAIYGQADWHATPKLTVNMGLRWEVQPGPTERHNQQSSFDFSGKNPFGPGTYVFPGTNGYGRNLYATHYRDFGPRAGAEYQLDNTTVIRGGFGYSYLPTNTGYGFVAQNTVPFTAHNVQNSTAVFGPNPDGQLIGTFYSPQVNVIVPAVGSNIANPQLYGGSNSGYLDYRNTLDGRVMQYNAFLEKSFTPKTIFSLGYSGTHGDHLPFSNVPVNGGTPNSAAQAPGFQSIDSGTLSAWRQQYIASAGAVQPWNAQVANPYAAYGFQGGALSSTQTSAWRLEVPYGEFPDLNVSKSIAHSTYNAMIAELRHTYSSGIEFDVNYVWSKEMDDAQNVGQSNDAFNNAGEQNTGYLLNLNGVSNRHLGFNDVPNRVVFSGLVESPFGKNRRFLANSKLAGAALGGWRVGTSFQYQTGTPIEITSSVGSLNNRANRIPGVSPMLPKSLQHWYSTAQNIDIPGPNGPVTVQTCSNCYEYLNPLAFGGPTIQTSTGYIADVFWYGNAQIAYSDIRSKSNIFLDAQLQRDFKITERVHFQLAANAYNVMNHTNFQPAQAVSVGGLQTQTGASTPIGYANGQGAFGLNFFDPRQLQIQGKLTF